jgi:hypothetical protein
MEQVFYAVQGRKVEVRAVGPQGWHDWREKVTTKVTLGMSARHEALVIARELQAKLGLTGEPQRVRLH